MAMLIAPAISQGKMDLESSDFDLRSSVFEKLPVGETLLRQNPKIESRSSKVEIDVQFHNISRIGNSNLATDGYSKDLPSTKLLGQIARHAGHGRIGRIGRIGGHGKHARRQTPLAGIPRMTGLVRMAGLVCMAGMAGVKARCQAFQAWQDWCAWEDWRA
jgi:hypothetical protein